MSLCSEFGGETATTKYICVGQGGLAFGAGECWAMFSSAHVMKHCQEGCMSVEAGVVSSGSFLCSVVARRRRVARRVSMEVRSADLGLSLFPFGSLVSMTLVGWM